MKKKIRIAALTTIALPTLLAGYLFVASCSIHPLAWNPQTSPAFTDELQLNEELSKIQKIAINGWYGPEDIAFDDSGNLYCGVHVGASDFSDGRILKIDSAGNVEEFYNSGSWVAGLCFDQAGNLIALSHREGLISIDKNKEVTVLAAKDDKGRPFLIPNGLTIASDGKIYFTNTSHESAYDLKYGKKIVLEMAPNGGLYCFDPQTKQLTTLIDGTYFGNGVALSQDESYLLMVETTKYQVLRYWLNGDKAGQTDVFIENLPGFPNGISRRDDGSFWLGFSVKRNAELDNIHPKPIVKKLVYGLPDWMQPKPENFGIILNISSDGKILRSLYDTTGKFAPGTGSVKERNGYLYFGGDVIPYICKYKLSETGN